MVAPRFRCDVREPSVDVLDHHPVHPPVSQRVGTHVNVTQLLAHIRCSLIFGRWDTMKYGYDVPSCFYYRISRRAVCFSDTLDINYADYSDSVLSEQILHADWSVSPRQFVQRALITCVSLYRRFKFFYRYF